MVARAYQAFFQSLAFHALPKIVHRYLGDAGFVDIVEALAEATIAALPHLLEATKGMVEVPGGDPLEKLVLHMRCHEAARRILGDESVGIFRVERLDENRVLFRAERCPHSGDSPLLIASYIGVIVGVLRALGARAYGARSREYVRHLARGGEVYAVYPAGEGCSIVVERLRS